MRVLEPWMRESGVGLRFISRMPLACQERPNMPPSPRVSTLAALLLLGGCDASLPPEPDGDSLRSHGAEAVVLTGLNLRAEDVAAACEATTLSLSAAVRNLGVSGIAASRAGIYAGDPAEGGTLLGSVEVPWLYGLERFSFERTFTVPEGTTRVFVVADDDRFYPEDDEEDNVASFTLPSPCVNPVSNLSPVARCQDVTVPADGACQAAASIDHGSYDPDSGPGALSVGQSPEGPFPAGSTPVQLTVSDGAASSSCQATVTVVDTTAPTPGASRGLVLTPSVVSGYVRVDLDDCALPASDNCGGALDVQAAGTLLRITSDEEEDALSLVRLLACGDIQLSADRKSALVRAESALLGNGRVYTFTYAVSDAAGNTSTSTCQVRVPALLGSPAVDSGPAYCQGTGCPAGTGSGLLCSL